MDWIDELKKAEDEKDSSRKIAEELRLLEARRLRALAPIMWQQLGDAIRTQLAALREKFPDRAEFHAQLIQHRESYLLQNEKFPIRLLSIELSIDSGKLLVFEAQITEPFQQPRLAPDSPVEIMDAEGALFAWRGDVIVGLHALAEKLVKHVCKIR